MTASLAHASPILTAAINAGFRESGVQSLKNLDDPSNAFPMVAIRTSGLAFESLIGYAADGAADIKERGGGDSPDDDDDDDVVIHSLLANQSHLQLLLDIANGRFVANQQRMRRFETELFSSSEETGSIKKTTIREWEDPVIRQARKRAEGLARKRDELHDKSANASANRRKGTGRGGDSGDEEEEEAEEEEELLVGGILPLPS